MAFAAGQSLGRFPLFLRFFAGVLDGTAIFWYHILELIYKQEWRQLCYRLNVITIKVRTRKF